MEIKQLRVYKTVSLLVLVAGALALQPFYENEKLLMVGFLAGILGSFLLGIAAITTLFRYFFVLIKSYKKIGLLKFLSGLLLELTVPLIWFIAIIRFVLIPELNGTSGDELVMPSMLAIVNGAFGLIYFGVVWPIKLKCVSQ
ncbi:MAG: hypothetical protein ACI8WB_003895 [Phenylobacterium sp.]|jgi:hypothetical protein